MSALTSRGANESVSDRRAGPGEIWLAGRLYLWSLALPILKRVLPLRTLVRLAWTRPRTDRRRPERERQVMRLAYAVWSRSRARRRDDDCLERSLAAFRFLSRLNADPELVAGTRMAGGEVQGHVWVVVDGQPFGEARAELAEYLPVIAFGAGGRETWRAGSGAGAL